MPRLVAALGADVLVPILSCDFLLTEFDLGLYEPVVSVEVLDEVERNLPADFPHLDPAAIRRRVGQMRDALEGHLVDPGSFDGVPDAINPKDRHVIAAALAGEATFVVSNDMKLRAETETADIGLLAMGADDFAAYLWELMPDDVGEVISGLVAKRSKRPVTTEELMEALRSSFPRWPPPGSTLTAADPVPPDQPTLPATLLLGDHATRTPVRWGARRDAVGKPWIRRPPEPTQRRPGLATMRSGVGRPLRPAGGGTVRVPSSEPWSRLPASHPKGASCRLPGRTGPTRRVGRSDP